MINRTLESYIENMFCDGILLSTIVKPGMLWAFVAKSKKSYEMQVS